MYFLPYVAFLIEKFPTIRFICLKREREKVIQSYLKWTNKYNHWYEHNGDNWQKYELWDAAFPKFNEPDKAKDLGLYWDIYHQEIERLIEKYPQHICCFHTQTLNSINGRNEILDFIEYSGYRNIEGKYHVNKQLTILDRIRMNCAEVLIYLGRQFLPKFIRHQLWLKFSKFFYN